MHRQLVILLVVLGSLMCGCGVKRNPEACDESESCSDGFVCNLDTNRCEPAPDGGVGPACSVSEDCPATTPVCEAMECRQCVLDDECQSGVCLAEGFCEVADAILYVSPTGVSAGACSSTNTCDLNYARTQLTTTRHTIRLAAGTYNLTTDFNVAGSTMRVTIVGGASSVLQRSTTGPVVQVTGGASVTLRGFSATRGVACTDSKLTVKRLTFDAATETRPWIAGAGCALTVEDSDLHGSSSDGVVALSGSTTQPPTTIVHSKITDSVGNGLRVSNGAGISSVTTSVITGNMQMGIRADNTKLIVSRSTISSNRRGGISLTGPGSTYDITNNFVFRNGNDTDGEFGGLRLAPDASGPNRVRHNTIVWNDSRVDASPPYAGGLYCNFGVATNNIVSNNFSGNTTQPNSQFAGSCDTTSSIIDSGAINFLFISPIAPPFDYHLSGATSPAVGVAVPSDVTVDFDGDPRTANAPDVGADEFPF